MTDSSKSDFWQGLYERNKMPWDFGGVPKQFKEHIDGISEPARILIPGCGSAYEALYLAKLAWDVLAIDFADAALQCAANILGEHAESAIKKADFFELQNSFDIVYERAFLAALPPTQRTNYAAKMADLIPTDGQLIGYFLIGETTTKGPPFFILDADLNSLLNPYFERVVDTEASDSLALFAGKERFQVWIRRP